MLAAATTLACAVMAPAVRAATPAKTDVLFVFDTSGSMSSELAEAKEKIVEVMGNVRAHLPDVSFGVSNVEDIPGYENGTFKSTLTEQEYAENKEKAWRLDQALTSEQSKVLSAVSALTIGFGGDGPEAYSRALWEADTNPTVGWRPGARHEIVLIADNVPHDPNLNEGVAESKWIANPFNTFTEPPGKFGIAGTLWTSGTNLGIRSVASQLSLDGKPLQSVEFFGSATGYLPYWEYWAGLSGGQALEGNSGTLATALTSIIESGTAKGLGGCPAGQFRSGEEGCAPLHPTATQVICNLIVATASDTCTATVGDAAAAAQSNPTGSVTFTSGNGGVFAAGSTCTLTPSPGTTSSCSVQFLPPSAPSALPAITAAYGGDGSHTPSSAHTHYGAASELAKEVSWSEVGTIHEGTVSFPFSCGFPCAVTGELVTTPPTAGLASVASVELEEVLAGAAAKHGKKHRKKFKPSVIGKGSVTLAAPGKGILVIRLSTKARKQLAKLGKKTATLTLTVTVTTANGTLVRSTTGLVRIKQQQKKKAKKKTKKKH